MTGSGPRQGRARVALGVLGAICCVALLPTGCFFHLDDVEHGAAGKGGTGNDVSQGGSGGGSSDGGATGGGAGGAAAMAGSGTGGAGGMDCIRVDDPTHGCGAQDCMPCKGLDSTVFTCMNSTCTIMGCKPGYGDCNGLNADGCEINFADLPNGTAPDLVLAPRATQIDVNGVGDEMDWSRADRTPIAQPCANCMARSPIPKVADKSVPRPDDLSAWFRVTWDDFKLYALVEVRDDSLVSKPGPSYDPGMLGASVLEDAVELLISTYHSMGDYTENDMQLYFPLDGVMSRPDKPPPTSDLGNKLAVVTGHGCYTVELSMTFQYMVPHDPSFTPADRVLGFTAAVNDWDYDKKADGGLIPTFQSHLFSKDPGDNYWFMTAGFGSLKLVKP